jgi:hypothetical protein
MLLAQQDPANDNGIFLYVVPRQPGWLFDVDGELFFTLADAETYSKRIGKAIYCKPRQKAKP